MAANPITVTRELAKKLAGGTTSPAEKALAAAVAAEKKADDFRDANSGWRFTGRPHSQQALDKLEADTKALREDAHAKRRVYQDLTGTTRVDRRDPNAPKIGDDKSKTGLRRRTEDRTPPVNVDPNHHPDMIEESKSDILRHGAAAAIQRQTEADKGKPTSGTRDISKGPFKPAPLQLRPFKREGGRHSLGDTNGETRVPGSVIAESMAHHYNQRALGNQRSKREDRNNQLRNGAEMTPKDQAHENIRLLMTNRGRPAKPIQTPDQQEAIKVARAMVDQINMPTKPTPKPVLPPAAPKEDKSAQSGLKVDSKPGAGDRRSNSQSGLHKLALAQGWTEKKTKNGWILQSPDGKSAVGYHMTPSDRRAYMNLRTDLEKAGLKIPGRRSGDIKMDSSKGPERPRTVPRLPRTGPGTNDQFTGGPPVIPPDPRKGPGGIIVATHPGPAGDIFSPKPPLPPTGRMDQDTSDRTGLNKPGSGTIIAKSNNDKGTPSGEVDFNHPLPQRDPSLPKVRVEKPLKNVPHKGTTFQKPVEPYVKPVFQPKPKDDSTARAISAVRDAQNALRTKALIEKGQRDPNSTDGLTKKDGSLKGIGRK